MRREVSALFLLITVGVLLAAAKEQRVTVKGQVICDKRSVRNVLIQLREHDTCKCNFFIKMSITFLPASILFILKTYIRHTYNFLLILSMYLVDPDDQLGETHSDKDGYFTLSGAEDEVGSIRVSVNICNCI